MGRAFALACALALALVAAVAAPPAYAQPRGFAAAAQTGMRAPVEDVIADAPTTHPVAMLYLARRLYELDRREEALFWFYEGQLRWRALLYQTPNGREQGAFRELFEQIGPDINAYAFCDLDAFEEMVTRTIAWDNEHEDPFATDRAAKRRAQEGLRSLVGYAREHAGELEEARRQEQCAPVAAGGDMFARSGGAVMGTPQSMVQPYDPSRIANFQVGVTTREQVVETLGRPEWWEVSDDGTAMGYSYMREFIPGMLSERVSLSFQFDANHVLREIRLPREREG